MIPTTTSTMIGSPSSNHATTSNLPPPLLSHSHQHLAKTQQQSHQPLLTTQRPLLGLLVMEENGASLSGEKRMKDITVLHSKWDPEKTAILVPGQRRLAIQWQAAHTYFSHDGHEMFICNICGRDLKLSGSVSAITAHLTHKHSNVKAKMDEMEQQLMQQQQQRQQQQQHYQGVGSGGPIVWSSSGGSAGKKRTLDNNNSTPISPSRGILLKIPRGDVANAAAVVARNSISSGDDGGGEIDSRKPNHHTQKQQPHEQRETTGPTEPTTKSTPTPPMPSTNSSSSKSTKVTLTAIEAQTKAQVMQMVALNLPLGAAAAQTASQMESPWFRLWMETIVAAARTGANASDLQMSETEVRGYVKVLSTKLQEHLRDHILLAKNETNPNSSNNNNHATTTTTREFCGVLECYQPHHTAATYSTFRVQWIESFQLFSATLWVRAPNTPDPRDPQGRRHVGPPEKVEDNWERKLHLEWGDVTLGMKFWVVSDPYSNNNNTFSVPKSMLLDNNNDNENENNHDNGKKTKNLEYRYVPCLDSLLQLLAIQAFECILGNAEYGGRSNSRIFENEDITDYHYDDDDNSNNHSSSSSSPHPLTKIRALVRYFQDSILANGELMRIADLLRSEEDPAEDHEEEAGENEFESKEWDGLVSDGRDSPWWWSTHAMLERVWTLREAITIYVGRQWASSSSTLLSSKSHSSSHPRGILRPPKLTELEWEQMEQLCLALSPLRLARQLLRIGQPRHHHPSPSPTASLVPLVLYLVYRNLERIHLSAKQKKIATVREATQRMLHMLDREVGDFASRKYQGDDEESGDGGGGGASSGQVHIPMVYLYAHALDPRFKRLVVFSSVVQEKIWSSLLEEMISLSPARKMDPPTSAAAASATGKPSSEESKPPDCSTSSRNTPNDFHTDPPAAAAPPPSNSAGSKELDTLFKLYAHKQTASGTQTKAAEERYADDWNRKCELELSKYREADPEGVITHREPIRLLLGTNMLRQWWGASGHLQYPILYRLVQRFWAIPAVATVTTNSSSLGGGTTGAMGSNDDKMVPFLQANAAFLRDDRLWVD